MTHMRMQECWKWWN